MQTDASDVGISGALNQVDLDGNHRVISLVSKCLNEAEVNYSTTEKELLVIVYAVTKLRIYLLGTRFLIITDHKGLIFLNSTQYLNSRLIRWSILLQSYDFDVQYCRGVVNVVADFFSRNPERRFESVQPNQLSIDVLEVRDLEIGLSLCSMVEMPGELEQSLKNLAILQRQDQYIQGIIVQLENGNRIDLFVIREEILFRKDSFFECMAGRVTRGSYKKPHRLHTFKTRASRSVQNHHVYTTILLLEIDAPRNKKICFSV